jgi:hypothetical protein
LLGEHSTIAVPRSVAKSYETGDWASSVASTEIARLGSDVLNDIYLKAARWAETALPPAATNRRLQRTRREGRAKIDAPIRHCYPQ